MEITLGTILCQVDDMDRSVEFYRGVLGLKFEYESPHWSSFSLGAARVGLHPPFDGSSATSQDKGAGWILGVSTNDIRALRQKLEEAGAWVSEGYHDTPSGAIMDFRDPDGHWLQAIQPGAKSADLA